MAKKKFTLEDAEDVTADVVLRRRVKGTPHWTPVEHQEDDDVEVNWARLKSMNLKFTAGDEIEYSESDFQAALTSVENILSTALAAKHTEEMHRIMARIREEKAKTRPDLKKVREWLSRMLGFISLAKLAKPIAESARAFFGTVVAKYFGLG